MSLRSVAASVDELLAGASEREPFAYEGGKSGVRMERVTIDGERYILKYLHINDDWIMRGTRDLGCRNVLLWRSGWLDRLPSCIDHTIAGAAWDDRPDGRGGAVLMRDVGEWLLPEDEVAITPEQHRRFIDHMALMHAAFWGCSDDIGLLDVATRYTWPGPHLPDAERAAGGTHPVPTRFVEDGWRRFGERAALSGRAVLGVHADPSAFLRALASTPWTFVHGDWKASNLGADDTGRTILIDWAFPGVAPACSDLVWYLCMNRARLPETKEEAIDAYRAALERHGIDTGQWWGRQLGLCLLGALVQFGWEKALGDGPDHEHELDWWDRKAAEGARHLAAAGY